MNSRKVKNKLVRKIAKPTKKAPHPLLKLHTKLYISIDLELVEYDIHDIMKDGTYVLVEKESGEMVVVREYDIIENYCLSRKMLETIIREQLNDKLYKLSKSQADEWSIKYYK